MSLESKFGRPYKLKENKPLYADFIGDGLAEYKLMDTKVLPVSFVNYDPILLHFHDIIGRAARVLIQTHELDTLRISTPAPVEAQETPSSDQSELIDFECTEDPCSVLEEEEIPTESMKCTAQKTENFLTWAPLADLPRTAFSLDN